MKVTLSAFRAVGNDANGHPIPVGKDRISCELRTTDGAFAAISADACFVRLSTDTAIHMDITGGSTSSADELIPAGATEFFFVNGGEAFSILTA